MLTSGRWSVAWFLALGVVLVLGVWQLLSLRYEQGDVYPAYSTLRSDPLGARAVYDAFDALPEVRCRRNFEPLERMGSGQDTTLLVLGADWDDFDLTDDSEAELLDRFLRSGGRLVVVFRGRLGESVFRQSNQAAQRRLRVKGGRNAPITMGSQKAGELERRWGVALDYRALPTNVVSGESVVEAAMAERGMASADLPEQLEWRSALVFNIHSNAAPEWRTVYHRDGAPVLAERTFGQGSLVLMSDAFFVSNEALWRDRQAALLGWLMGGNRSLVFDETHLGVAEQPGLATLLRRYQLYWLVAAALAVFGLAIWRNASPLVPVLEQDALALAREGRDSRSGLVNLLRRTIPRAELLGYCFREWKKSGHARRQVSADRLRRAESLAAEAEPKAGVTVNPAETYREIARTLRRR